MSASSEVSNDGEEMPPFDTPDIFFRPADPGDLDSIHALEAASYPPDEAADRERLAARLHEAGDFFLEAVRLGGDGALAVVGFCCGTLSSAPSLTHESMATHEPDGTTLCIHSVCVGEGERRKGVATRMLRAYLMFIQQAAADVQRVVLICKAPLVGLYEGAGFALVGPSPVVHGQEPWVEMELQFEGSEDE